MPDKCLSRPGNCCHDGSVDVRVEIAGDDSADEVRSLREWLVDEESLRGRVRLVAAPPREGTLGTGVDALVIALGNGGAVTALATVAVAWLKRRTGRMKVKFTRADGATVEISTDLVRPQTAQELRETVEVLTRELGPVRAGAEGE
jgi:hypothetical protein